MTRHESVSQHYTAVAAPKTAVGAAVTYGKVFGGSFLRSKRMPVFPFLRNSFLPSSQTE
jgi:hypothetical protein